MYCIVLYIVYGLKLTSSNFSFRFTPVYIHLFLPSVTRSIWDGRVDVSPLYVSFTMVPLTWPCAAWQMRIKDYILETIIVVRQMIVTLFQTIVKPFYIECYKTQTKVIITASQKERKISQNPMKVKVKSGKLPEVLKKNCSWSSCDLFEIDWPRGFHKFSRPIKEHS